MFSSNIDSLGYQSFKGASWALASGLHLGDAIRGLLLVLGPFSIPTFGLASWACAPIISNPIKNIFVYLINPILNNYNFIFCIYPLNFI